MYSGASLIEHPPQPSYAKQLVILVSIAMIVLIGIGVLETADENVYGGSSPNSTLKLSSLDILKNQPWLMNEFVAWTIKYDKVYHTEKEARHRIGIWKENFEKVSLMQHEPRTYQVGLTKFADLNLEEFRAIYFSPDSKHLLKKRIMNYVHAAPEPVPSMIDWRKVGAVTPVKDQGLCNSGWAHAAVGALEAAYFLSTKQLVPLSAQQLIDCSSKFGNEGCRNGFVDLAFEYVMAKGIMDNTSYPDHFKQGKCHYKESEVRFNLPRFSNIVANDSEQLTAAVARQPIAVFVSIDPEVLQFYTAGILDMSACGDLPNMHLLLVGYNDAMVPNYWIAKTSLGDNFGEEGYIRIFKGYSFSQSICGITDYPSYPVLA